MMSLFDLLNPPALCREEAFTSFTQVKVAIHQYKLQKKYQPIVLPRKYEQSNHSVPLYTYILLYIQLNGS